jgi:hypothetical protein
MLRKGISPDAMTYNVLIARISNGDADDADDNADDAEFDGRSGEEGHGDGHVDGTSGTSGTPATAKDGAKDDAKNTTTNAAAAEAATRDPASRAVRRATAWYDEMRARGVLPDRDTFRLLIDVCGQSGRAADLARAERFFNHLTRQHCAELAAAGVHPDADIFNAMLIALAKADPSPPPPSSQSPPALSKAGACAASKLDRADAYLAEMQERGIDPTCETFNAMLMACANSSVVPSARTGHEDGGNATPAADAADDVRLLRAEEYWDNMRALGVQCNEITLSALIRLCKTVKSGGNGNGNGDSRVVRAARVARAVELAEECSSDLESRLGKMDVTGKTTASSSSASSSSSRDGAAVAALEEGGGERAAQLAGGDTDDAAAVHIADADNLISAAHLPSSVVAAAAALPPPPPPSSYADVVSRLRPDLAIHQMEAPDVSAFNGAIAAYLDATTAPALEGEDADHRQCRLADVEQLLREMRRRGVQPDATTFSSLVMAAVHDETHGCVPAKAHKYAKAYRKLKRKEGREDAAAGTSGAGGGDAQMDEHRLWVGAMRRRYEHHR